MPKYLKHMLTVEVLAFLVSLLVLPTYEEGFQRIASPLVFLLLIALCFAFWRRLRFSDFALKVYCLAGAIAGAFFLAVQYLMAPHEPIQPQQLVLLCDSLVGVLLYAAMRGRRATHWFQSGSRES